MTSIPHNRGATHGKGFPYETALAYLRGELSGTIYSWVKEQLSHPSWQAHLGSAQFLDLERAAAIQDAEDLRAFARSGTFSPFCRQVAQEGDKAFTALTAGDTVGSAAQWSAHLGECVYCRRMRRASVARKQAEKLREPLLRDWLLSHYYAKPLAAATRAAAPVRLGSVAVAMTKSGFQAVRISGTAGELASSGGVLLALLAWVVKASEFRPAKPVPVFGGSVVTLRGGSPPTLASVEPPHTPGVIELTQALGEGELTVTLTTDEKGNLSWQVAVLPSGDPAATAGVTLEIEYGNQTWARLGQGGELRIHSGEPSTRESPVVVRWATKVVTLRVTVREGEKVLEECTFTIAPE